jgi:nicotinate-nucleotide adenylyltransferase
MVRLAVAEDPHIAASEIDAPRADGRPNFTVDLLRQVRSEINEKDKLFFLLGADSFLSLRQWHGAAELPFLCSFIVAGRPGSSIEDVRLALPEGITTGRKGYASISPQLVEWQLCDEARPGSELYFMPDLQEEISATDIRAAIGGDQSATGLLAPAVLRYIEDHGLYR